MSFFFSVAETSAAVGALLVSWEESDDTVCLRFEHDSARHLDPRKTRHLRGNVMDSIKSTELEEYIRRQW